MVMFKVSKNALKRFLSECFGRNLNLNSVPLSLSSYASKCFPIQRLASSTLLCSSTGCLLLTARRTLSMAAAMAEIEDSLDPVQRQLLEEECILLDENDRVTGYDSKRNCHLVRNGDILLHRAFSVFLFNTNGDLLIQQRSKSKITFPLMWTNTCCSHPLNLPSELVEDEAIGVKTAAKRRLEIELGIPSQSIRLEDFHYLTRIHYKALSNSIWGEHEIDYILFLQKDLEIDPNPNEIESVSYVSLANIFNFKKENELLTPWFKLILESHLPLWWKHLSSLKQFEDHKTILRM